MTKFLPGLFFLLFVNIVFGQQTSVYKKLADKSYQDKKYDEATKYYTQALDSGDWEGDTLANIYFKRAVCYEHQHDDKNALSDYTSAIRFRRNFTAAYCNRASVYNMLGENDKALSDYNKCLSFTKPGQRNQLKIVYDGMAEAYFRTHEIDSALKYSTYAIQEDTYWSNAFGTRGMILQSLKQYTESIEAFDHAIGNIDEDNQELLWYYYLQRGNSKNLNRHSKDAIRDFEYAIRLKPDNLEANWNRAYCYYIIKDFRTAASAYTHIIPLFAGDDKRMASLYFWRAKCELPDNLYADAIKDDSLSISLNHDVEGAYTDLATAYAANGNFDMAIAKYRIALTFGKNSDKENSIIYTNIAQNQYWMNNDMEAITSFNKAIDLDAHNFYSYFCRGIVYLNHIKNKEQATFDFNKVIDLDTSHRTHDYIFALFYTGKQDEAISILQDMLKKADNKVAERNEHYSLASLYAMMNDAGNANHQLEAAINEGYSLKEIERDENLNSIRNTERYKAIIGNGK